MYAAVGGWFDWIWSKSWYAVYVIGGWRGPRWMTETEALEWQADLLEEHWGSAPPQLYKHTSGRWSRI